MSIEELDILKSALENDISWQKDNQDMNKPAFKKWLLDSEILLKKLRRELSKQIVIRNYKNERLGGR